MQTRLGRIQKDIVSQQLKVVTANVYTVAIEDSILAFDPDDDTIDVAITIPEASEYTGRFLSIYMKGTLGVGKYVKVTRKDGRSVSGVWNNAGVGSKGEGGIIFSDGKHWRAVS